MTTQTTAAATTLAALTALAATTAAFATSSDNPKSPIQNPKSPRPNIVFILSDDHSTSTISAYGEERHLVDTPQLDRIAKEGMRFDRCLVTNAICGPARATIITGKYSHINGFMNNTNSRFDGSQTTFPKLLQAAGYQTAIIGKWHLQTDPTGFDTWKILPGQGQYYNPTMIFNGKRLTVPGYVTDIIADLTLDWLKKRDTTRPFLIMMHNKAPHRHWEPPLRYLDADHDRVYPEPPTLMDDYAGRGPAEHENDMNIRHTMTDEDTKLSKSKPGKGGDKGGRLTPAQQAEWDKYYDPRNAAFRAANLKGDDLVRWKYQRYMHDYTATIRGIDENVGRVLDYLDKNGLSDNTIVIYNSDQGFYLGEHNWFDKRWIFEESLRTPFMVRWPGVIKPGTVNKDIVSNLDFASTLLEAAGVPVPAEIQGRSLLPLFRGATPPDWRKTFYYEYYEYPAPHHVMPHEGVVTDRYKFVHFIVPGREYYELFDLQTDPHELTSVYGKSDYKTVQKDLADELARLKTEYKVPATIPPHFFGNKNIDTTKPSTGGKPGKTGKGGKKGKNKSGAGDSDTGDTAGSGETD